MPPGTAGDTKQPSPIDPWYDLAVSAFASKLTVSLLGAAEHPHVGRHEEELA